ncbi:helix-turn-helix domain-containing protein, partial [Nocardia farcinica]|uniref:helix-turn-helix domain-containing protein n=1 Tax=Nocardia farcinica TaxID=37329 RepID=UPI003CC7C682
MPTSENGTKPSNPPLRNTAYAQNAAPRRTCVESTRAASGAPVWRSRPSSSRSGRRTHQNLAVSRCREWIIDGTNEGLAAARARGQRLGRPPAMTAEQIRQARAILTRPEETVSSVARLLGVSRSTIYKHLP